LSDVKNVKNVFYYKVFIPILTYIVHVLKKTNISFKKNLLIHRRHM